MKKIAIKYTPSSEVIEVGAIDAWPQSPLEYEVKNFEVRDEDGDE